MMLVVLPVKLSKLACILERMASLYEVRVLFHILKIISTRTPGDQLGDPSSDPSEDQSEDPSGDLPVA